MTERAMALEDPAPAPPTTEPDCARNATGKQVNAAEEKGMQNGHHLDAAASTACGPLSVTEKAGEDETLDGDERVKSELDGQENLAAVDTKSTSENDRNKTCGADSLAETSSQEGLNRDLVLTAGAQRETGSGGGEPALANNADGTRTIAEGPIIGSTVTPEASMLTDLVCNSSDQISSAPTTATTTTNIIENIGRAEVAASEHPNGLTDPAANSSTATSLAHAQSTNLHVVMEPSLVRGGGGKLETAAGASWCSDDDAIVESSNSNEFEVQRALMGSTEREPVSDASVYSFSGSSCGEASSVDSSVGLCTTSSTSSETCSTGEEESVDDLVDGLQLVELEESELRGHGYALEFGHPIGRPPHLSATAKPPSDRDFSDGRSSSNSTNSIDGEPIRISQTLPPPRPPEEFSDDTPPIERQTSKDRPTSLNFKPNAYNTHNSKTHSTSRIKYDHDKSTRSHHSSSNTTHIGHSNTAPARSKFPKSASTQHYHNNPSSNVPYFQISAQDKSLSSLAFTAPPTRYAHHSAPLQVPFEPKNKRRGRDSCSSTTSATTQSGSQYFNGLSSGSERKRNSPSGSSVSTLNGQRSGSSGISPANQVSGRISLSNVFNSIDRAVEQAKIEAERQVQKEVHRSVSQHSNMTTPKRYTSIEMNDGQIFLADYLGSTQIVAPNRIVTEADRQSQAQLAAKRVKAPHGEAQPKIEVQLFISTQKFKVIDVFDDAATVADDDTMMIHPLHSISYIADIGDLLVVIAKRHSTDPFEYDSRTTFHEYQEQKLQKFTCHVFQSVKQDSQMISNAIGQAFNYAYREFLEMHGLGPDNMSHDQYRHMLDVHEIYHDDLNHYTKKDSCKEIWISKYKGEPLGIVLVESGWGSIVPTFILANMKHGGPAELSTHLSIGDQVMAVDGVSLVGLPMAKVQEIFKQIRQQTVVKVNIVNCPPTVTVRIRRPSTTVQLGFSVQAGIICSLMRGGIAEKGGVRVGHKIIEINNHSVVATSHDKIVSLLQNATGEIIMKTMPAAMFRLLTGVDTPSFM